MVTGCMSTMIERRDGKWLTGFRQHNAWRNDGGAILHGQAIVRRGRNALRCLAEDRSCQSSERKCEVMEAHDEELNE